MEAAGGCGTGSVREAIASGGAVGRDATVGTSARPGERPQEPTGEIRPMPGRHNPAESARSAAVESGRWRENAGADGSRRSRIAPRRAPTIAMPRVRLMATPSAFGVIPRSTRSATGKMTDPLACDVVLDRVGANRTSGEIRKQRSPGRRESQSSLQSSQAPNFRTYKILKEAEIRSYIRRERVRGRPHRSFLIGSDPKTHTKAKRRRLADGQG